MNPDPLPCLITNLRLYPRRKVLTTILAPPSSAIREMLVNAVGPLAVVGFAMPVRPAVEITTVHRAHTGSALPVTHTINGQATTALKPRLHNL